MKKHPIFVVNAVKEIESKGLKGKEEEKCFSKAVGNGTSYYAKQINECINGFERGDLPLVMAALKINLKAMKETASKQEIEAAMLIVKKVNLKAESRAITPEDVVIMNDREETVAETAAH